MSRICSKHNETQQAWLMAILTQKLQKAALGRQSPKLALSCFSSGRGVVYSWFSPQSVKLNKTKRGNQSVPSAVHFVIHRASERHLKWILPAPSPFFLTRSSSAQSQQPQGDFVYRSLWSRQLFLRQRPVSKLPSPAALISHTDLDSNHGCCEHATHHKTTSPRGITESAVRWLVAWK